MEIISPSKPPGYLSIVLHAHLPFIRYPSHEDHLEENWLNEAITETYIPLLDMFGNLLSDGIDFRITISLSPTLVCMFNDEVLMTRYQKYIDSRVELAEKEISRTSGDPGLRAVARMYHKRFLKIRHLFEEVYRKDLTSAFGQLLGSGRIELITCPATHPFLPALFSVPETAWFQIVVGAEYFRGIFGDRPAGMWLPECGFVPGIDTMLRNAAMEFIFLEGHGLPGRPAGSIRSIYAPVRTPSGATAFFRDPQSSRQVWSSIGGYPGDPDYRDFYRDIGFDLSQEYVGPYLPGGIRTFTGLKYYRITGDKEKKPYIASIAHRKARLHADHFIAAKKEQVFFLRKKLGISPLITAAYDAELFGHWWFEGPDWLNLLLRKGARTRNSFRFTCPSEYLSFEGELETAMPSSSSWGEGGHSSTWVNSSNCWIYSHLVRGARLMVEIAGKNISRGLLKRAADQAARELLLAQASDWAFMMKTGNASEFARNKFTLHMRNFLDLHTEITSGKIQKSKLQTLEQTNNLFPGLDHRRFLPPETSPCAT